MPERPLLVFPWPEVAGREKRKQFGPSPRIPSVRRQRERVVPQFRRLQVQLRQQRAHLQLDATGTPPEQVLVIKVVGKIEDFIRTVQRTGMEWLGGIEDYDIQPDEDFYKGEDDRESTLSGRLFLIMTDQRALNEMLSLWRRYSRDEAFKFPRGFTPWRDVFRHIKEIRFWGVEDRLLETGVLDDWRERVDRNEERIRFEAELWFRSSEQRREQAVAAFRHLIEEDGGTIVAQSAIPEIAYQGILAELPIGSVQRALAHEDLKFLLSNDVMFFRPVGQAVDGIAEGQSIAQAVENDGNVVDGTPVLALLDGLPLSNHRQLAGQLIIDDPDDFASSYTAREQIHGTAMASLIVRGDLDAGESALGRAVYVRPILRPDPNALNSPKPESMPDDILAVDLLHRSVKRIFEGDGDEDAVAPTVRFINLSIGDPNRLFDSAMSSLARLLDWLSYKYNVLFLVSAGNHGSDLILDHPKGSFSTLTPTQKEEKVVKAVAADLRHRRLLAPAESINAITVGSIHEDRSTITHFGHRIDPHSLDGLPSPFNAIGLGYRKAIKPDLIMPGGRQYYVEKIGAHTKATLQLSQSCMAPGQKAAAPGTAPGVLNHVRFSRGTSNATAMASRAVASVYEALQELRGDTGSEMLHDDFMPVLSKALLAHGASWGDAQSRLETILAPNGDRAFRETACRYLGYGKVEVDRLLECTAQRATIMGTGNLAAEDAHVFSVPLPPSVAGVTTWKRMTVTLAWFTPVRPTTRAYRCAYLWFEPPSDPLNVSRKNADWRAARRGTLQHEILEGDRADAFVDGDALSIKVNCKEDASPFTYPVRYALVASLEVAEDVNLPVYEEVRARIQPAVRVEPRAGS